ncbi:CHK domain-containing protein [Frankia sp. Hr75.2]|nr:CHK domain-containing protein [Frankia sp. Hr75.2]
MTAWLSERILARMSNGGNGGPEPRALPIPADWDDVTPGWMTAALASRHPGSEVGEVRLVLRDDGNNRRARFGVTYSAGTGPDTVFCKAEGLGEHRVLHRNNGNMFNEPDLFASGAPLPVDHPASYLVVIDRPAEDYVIVMEDVTGRGADPRDATRPMTPDQVAHGLRGLARLHSRYWGFSGETDPELAWVRTWAATEGFAGALRTRVPTGVERGIDLLPDEVRSRSADELVGLWWRYVESLAADPPTLLHGDAHIGNTYVLPDGDVGFLDWQVARRGGWSQDVGYFLVGSLTVADRREHEADLVAEYLGALEVPGERRPSPEAGWLSYRASAAYGLAVWLSTLGTDGWQRRDVSLALAERYGAAFVELETEAALDRLRP